MSRKTRKLIWSAPLVAVFAVVGVLAAFGALGIGGVFANEVTNHPMNLKVLPADGNAGRTALVLTWDAPANGETPTGYRVDVSKNNKTYTFLAMTDAGTRTYTHSGVPGSTAGTTRHYRVFALNQHGAGKVSTWEGGITKKITTPGQVKPFDWTSTDPTKVVLTWTAPDDGGAGILGYCIRTWPTDTATADALTAITATNCTNSFATEGPGGSGNAYPDGPGGIIRILPATTYTHSGLKAEQKWSYEIYAVNKHGYSADKVSATRNATAADAKNPSPPGSLLAVQDTSASNRIINLYWTKPDAMGQEITGYEIEVSDRKSQWPSPTTPRAVADRLTGKMANGSNAQNGQLAPETDIVDGTVNTSPFVAIITMTDAGQDAAQPYQLQHTYDTMDPDGTGPEGERFASRLYYRVRTITNNDAADSELKSMSYAYADVPIGFDATASPAGFVTLVLAPLVGADEASVVGTPHQDTDGDTDNDDDSTPGEVHLTVSHQTDGAGSYRVDISTDDGATWVTHETDSLPINEYDYRGPDVKPGKGYRFRLFSKLIGLGLASDVVQDFAGHSKAPGEVRSLTATKDGAGMINLSWNHPTSDGGATIDTYCIVASQFGDGGGPLRAEVMVVDAPATPILEANCTRFGEPDKSPISIDDDVFQVEGTTTSVAFKGVLAETQWFFRVYGLNGATGPTNGTGASTETSLIRGLALGSERNDATTDSAVAPGAPGYLTAEDARDTNVQGVGKQGVLVLWTAPSNPAGAPVLGYKVERSTDDGANYTTLTDNLNTGETHIVDDIERPTDETRVYRVTSINSVDVGTETIMVTLPLAEHTVHVPPAAFAVTASDGAAGTATITWQAISGATSYHVAVITDDGNYTLVSGTYTEITDVTDREHMFTGLTSGTDYIFAVIAETTPAGTYTGLAFQKMTLQ